MPCVRVTCFWKSVYIFVPQLHTVTRGTPTTTKCARARRHQYVNQSIHFQTHPSRGSDATRGVVFYGNETNPAEDVEIRLDYQRRKKEKKP